MRTSWERRSEWFTKTFKVPVPPRCSHIRCRLATRDGERQIVCVDCGEITHRRPLDKRY